MILYVTQFLINSAYHNSLFTYSRLQCLLPIGLQVYFCNSISHHQQREIPQEDNSVTGNSLAVVVWEMPSPEAAAVDHHHYGRTRTGTRATLELKGGRNVVDKFETHSIFRHSSDVLPTTNTIVRVICLVGTCPLG